MAERPTAAWARRLAPLAAPIFLVVLGLVLFSLAGTQPAWLDGRIGPGLLAQWLSIGVIALSAIWLLVAAFGVRGGRSGGLLDAGDQAHWADNAATNGSIAAGLGLLSGVAAFALVLPVTGLVIACALAAGLVGWSTGERRAIGLGITIALGAAVPLILGATLLPPGTQLWPQGLT